MLIIGIIGNPGKTRFTSFSQTIDFLDAPQMSDFLTS